MSSSSESTSIQETNFIARFKILMLANASSRVSGLGRGLSFVHSLTTHEILQGESKEGKGWQQKCHQSVLKAGYISVLWLTSETFQSRQNYPGGILRKHML